MTRLVGQMLNLAQADALAVEPCVLVDLAEIGRDVVAMMAPKVIVQRLAQAHGGIITVENPTGGGALFRVSFAARPRA
ncbi:hypothetical protein [Sphingomonas sp. MMS24-J13]|uniref:hypothetical protein n=1 Tax=Sphingomonas sp. MMS24-J13 TaxID=3238686 RepID=UPI00384C48C6